MDAPHTPLAQGHLVSPAVGYVDTSYIDQEPVQIRDPMIVSPPVVTVVDTTTSSSPLPSDIALIAKPRKKKARVREVASRFRTTAAPAPSLAKNPMGMARMGQGPVKATAAALGLKDRQDRQQEKPNVTKAKGRASIAPRTAATPRTSTKKSVGSSSKKTAIAARRSLQPHARTGTGISTASRPVKIKIESRVQASQPQPRPQRSRPRQSVTVGSRIGAAASPSKKKEKEKEKKDVQTEVGGGGGGSGSGTVEYDPVAVYASATPSSLKYLADIELQWKFAAARLKHAFAVQKNEAESSLYGAWKMLHDRKIALGENEEQLKRDENGVILDKIVVPEMTEIDRLEGVLSEYEQHYDSLHTATHATTQRLPLSEVHVDVDAVMRALKACAGAITHHDIDRENIEKGIIDVAKQASMLSGSVEGSVKELVKARELLAALSMKTREEQSLAIHSIDI